MKVVPVCDHEQRSNLQFSGHYPNQLDGVGGGWHSSNLFKIACENCYCEDEAN